MRFNRRLPVGAEVLRNGGVHFRVWAPEAKSVEVELMEKEGRVLHTLPLRREVEGYHSVLVQDAGPGSLYKFKLPEGSFPDPASRFQPQGPHGPSEVIDPGAFQWSDHDWPGLDLRKAVLYEMHVGTFTPEGTWAAATAQLPELQATGITCLEIMPLAEFSGRFGWGYDGVDLFAPTHLYGRPEEVKAFIDRAHQLGLAVILDVVYNHLGPDGNYLGKFSKNYFTSRYACEWGEAINFDGEGAAAVREFFLSNARYWIEEFHFDGFRLDATQQIFDQGKPHILAEITRTVREAARGRRTIIIGENESQHSALVQPLEEGGHGLDGLWNDDFHHAARVAATGRREAYYLDYTGRPQELLAAVKYGFLYQGQYYQWQKKRRGAPALHLESWRFVHYLQNHDQVANSLRGDRLHQITSPGRFRTLTALLLLGPATPLLFQGQEFGSSTPFLYFADHNPELNQLVSKGRREFLSQFPSIALPESAGEWREPAAEETFQVCKLRFEQRERHAKIYQLHRDLLKIRREQAAITSADWLDGAMLGESAFVVRYFGKENDDRLLLVNLGPELRFSPCPEPLLAPLAGKGWNAMISTEDAIYGGLGGKAMETTEGWVIPAESASFMEPDEKVELKSNEADQDG